MERNRDKIKQLEHELGRWKKRADDLSGEIKRLKEALGQAIAGNRETQSLVDAVLTAVVLAKGERATDPDDPGKKLGWRLILPRFSAKEMREKYEIHARRDKDGAYILGVSERSAEEE